MTWFGRGRVWADVAGIAIVMAAVVGVVAVEAAQDPQARQGGKISPKIAVESHGMRTTGAPQAPTEAEMGLCAQGDAAMCRKGYQYVLSRSAMDTARGSFGAVPSEADVAACEGGSRGACATVAAALWPHIRPL